MFSLDQSSTEWRRQMLAAGIKTSELMELESHLHEEIERQIRLGAPKEKAFALAIARIGSPRMLKAEFSKVDAENWNRPLAFAAWMIFMISFFLPSYCYETGWDLKQLWGYQCATLQGFFWSKVMWGDWISIHYELLTLANLVMLASPFCFLWRRGISLKSCRCASLAALVLVWSFLLLLLLQEGGHNLRVGCYVWASSFLMLHLSTIRKRALHFESAHNL